jgi:isopenicillin N synthase-like dioxygenase
METAMASAGATAVLAENLRGRRVRADEIPLIDFGAFLKGDAAEKKQVARAIGHACEEIGFFYIRNHGVERALRDTAIVEMKRFFALPQVEKDKISVRHSPVHRGYYGSGEENLDPGKQRQGGDLKEGINIGRDLGPDDPDVKAGRPLHGANQWPANLPGWKDAMNAYYAAMVALGKQMMSSFAVALDMQADHFEKDLTKPMTTLRLLHYPPQQGTITEDQLGCGAHTDFGCFTMLWQDQVGGLQVRSGKGEWIDATPIPDTYVVNVGDMMARWTNDRFASTFHRVINASGAERYSMPFFFDPNFDAEVRCLPTCLRPGERPRYAPTSGGQHLLDRIDETFAYRKTL